ncbi:MAG: SGNH/GDSL hydrolase family protein [Phycisphaerales bacterium]
MSVIKQSVLSLLCVMILSSVAHAGPYNRLVIFGDSLSDAGNAYDQLGTLAMDPNDYYMGRFSNGPLWVEYLAQQLQLPQPVGNEISSAGRDYAFGGAWTDVSGFNLTHLFINDLDEQVSDFINNDGGPNADDLITVWAGANNFLDGQTNTQTPVNHITSSITNLYNAGARSFMVVNLPLLGLTPRYLGTADAAPKSALASAFNSALNTSLNNLQTSLPGIEFFRIDAGALISDAVANPSAYGFTNVTNAALGLSGINADEYLFWDTVHPTTAAHNLLAMNATQALFDALSSLPGDLDFDGFVGIEDLNTILGNWNTHVTPGNPLFGDTSGDGFVGIDDLNLVLGNWNQGTPPGLADGNLAPEPASLALLGVTVLLSDPLRRR